MKSIKLIYKGFRGRNNVHASKQWGKRKRGKINNDEECSAGDEVVANWKQNDGIEPSWDGNLIWNGRGRWHDGMALWQCVHTDR
jgi:hypothetical protein